MNTTITATIFASAAGAARSIRRMAIAPAAGAALLLPLAIAQPASAQWYEDDGWYDDREQYEYGSDEGWHEEEWYDPTDWFDDEPYNYEYDEYGYEAYDYDSSYGNQDDYYDYGYDYDNGSSYDYYDSYRNTNSRSNSNRYQDRDRSQNQNRYQARNPDRDQNQNEGRNQNRDRRQYENLDRYENRQFPNQRNQGQYQNRSGSRNSNDSQDRYGNQPFYTDQNRSGNRDRYNGQDDYGSRRAQPGGRPYYLDRESDRRQGQPQAWRDRNDSNRYGPMQSRGRYQGSVQDIASVNAEERPDEHMILRITMQDGRSVMADFGPELKRDKIPFKSGDRVMLTGDRMSSQGRTLLVVESITLKDKSIKLREGEDSLDNSGDNAEWIEPRETDTESMDRKDRERWSTDQQTRDGQRSDRMRQNQWPVGQNQQSVPSGMTNFSEPRGDDRENQWGRDDRKQDLYGQDSYRQDRDSRDRFEQKRGTGKSQSRTTDRDRSGETKLDGTLSEVRRLGQAEDHEFIRVRMDNGRTAVFAVSEENAKKLREHSGESVKLTGKWDTLRGRDVIKLDSIDLDSKDQDE